ncbi:VOC family protein [Chromobacterium alticapitis]|uniref:Glyoxalase/bleomycin resistance/dioxygenase family protein n=1 Tax=Chromobacterium alticapitis TaxID=2073169 RepID=A0A2S5DGL5_9NEIS|nr:VOC family protein [Chromobacterium alticapitis]POZ62236.1 glyoxalase/bleomycin resistance/dioxygenase family protein [Chromobacterium alticapitis]
MAPTTLGIDHIHVYVRDRAAAEAWYEHVLGLTRLAALAAWSQDGGPLTLADAAHSIHLALFERANPAPGPAIALRVDAAGFLAWREHLQNELGRRLDAVDHDLSWSMYFADPDGNGYEITSYDYAELAAGLSRDEA